MSKTHVEDFDITIVIETFIGTQSFTVTTVDILILTFVSSSNGRPKKLPLTHMVMVYFTNNKQEIINSKIGLVYLKQKFVL